MRRLIALGALLLAFVVAGCGEVAYKVQGGEHQLYVEDTDGSLDQHNIDTACGRFALPVDVEWIAGVPNGPTNWDAIDRRHAALVTCPGGKD